MRDAVGGSLLLNIVVIITSVVILFFVGIIAYSKAYKIKNRIIEVIEKNENYNPTIAKEQLDSDLGRAGYIATNKDKINEKCMLEAQKLNIKDDYGVLLQNLNEINYGTGYLYCVFLKECENRSEDKKSCDGERIYTVVTFIHFNFPVIGDMMTFSVKGETKSVGRVYNY